MKAFMIATAIIPAAILNIISYAVKYRKAYWLISGYNNMSSDKKKNVDIEGLANFVSGICLGFAALLVLGFIFLLQGMTGAGMAVFALFIPLIIYTLIKSQSFDSGAYTNEGRMKKGPKAMIIAVSAFMIIVAVGVAILLGMSSKPAEFALTEGVFHISGLYGQDIAVGDIGELQITDTMPEVLARTNGSELGTKLKGNFRLEGYDKAVLFVDISKPPFILVRTKASDKTYIFNCEDSSATIALYEKLKTELDK
jgi:hypothetical protein